MKHLTVLLLKGLPASGKSTYAKSLASTCNYIRVNKDDLRAMMFGGNWTKEREKDVLFVRDTIIKEHLSKGRNVVIDDTNFHPKHEETISKIVESFNRSNSEYFAELKIDDKFLDVSLDECIERDSRRENPVGKKVILDMYYKYVHKENFYPKNPDLPNCIICDIDGTIADMKGIRGPFEWDKVDLDRPKMEIIDLVNSLTNSAANYNEDLKLFFFSGRDEVCREKTEKWLLKYISKYDWLFMRPQGNNESDVLIKKELFFQKIRNKYNVNFVIDDRRKVVDMWRSLGLTCLEVADHRF